MTKRANPILLMMLACAVTTACRSDQSDRHPSEMSELSELSDSPGRPSDLSELSELSDSPGRPSEISEWSEWSELSELSDSPGRPSDLSGPCPAGCPEGYCNEETGQCLACENDYGCPYPNQWCKEGKCVSTLCKPGSVSCPMKDVAATCAPDGESWLNEECQQGFACAGGFCQEVVCTPGETGCDQGLVIECDPMGVAWLPYPCPPGQGCFSGSCSPIKHNLLVIFDTSGSMSATGFLDTIPCICGQGNCKSKPFPQCEDPDCPISKLGLSKHVFNKFFDSENIGNASIVLTHFPMRIKYPPTQKCSDLFAMARGWYGIEMMDSDWMTDDDGSHVTEDGAWFDQYLYEVLAVPPPTSWEKENLDDLKLWVNFNEEVAPSQTPCSTKANCPGGFCASDEGTKVCWYHSDPELRALTNTPLGKSMFYAGEIYRKLIVPTGKPCTTDADCQNRNYYCSAKGICWDPFAHCRTNLILLFTDGVEEPPTDTSWYFNPRVQAKRFRYGLGCASDDDCFEGSTCNGNLCSGYPQPNGGGGGIPPNTETPWRLHDYASNPVQITTHVIDLSQGEGTANNQSIADDGGGIYYNPDTLDADKLLAQMMKLLDFKQNLLDCMPQVEEYP
jgi:hypothetical protein